MNTEYIKWISDLKSKVYSAQIKASVVLNKELIMFYWELGELITIKLEQSDWGDKVLENVSKDLRNEFPEMKGFSVTNLKYIKFFYKYFSVQNLEQIKSINLFSHQLGDSNQFNDNEDVIISHQPGDQKKINQLDLFIKSYVAQIPWRHIVEILTKVKDFNEVLFYIQKTKENNWSRDVLSLQLKTDLFKRNGSSITNFSNTLPEPFSDLAKQTLKDPYVFDFLQLAEGYKERDIENQLVNHIKKFLLELGKGFAFVGQQYNIQIANNDYFIDLLFYHIKLKCYIVIELKNTAFMPEYAGKLNFYLSAVDSILKEKDDKPTIGILLCREKNNIEAEFSLRDINKPMGISEFELTDILPENLKSSLPTIEELEQNLFKGK
jgi:predicted nuclease of restriction endonuclease-like (RecB) superfamily